MNNETISMNIVREELDRTITTLVDKISLVIQKHVSENLELDNNMLLKDLFEECNIQRNSYEYNVFHSSYQPMIVKKVETMLRNQGYKCKITPEYNKSGRVTRIYYKTRIISKISLYRFIFYILSSSVVLYTFVRFVLVRNWFDYFDDDM